MARRCWLHLKDQQHGKPKRMGLGLGQGEAGKGEQRGKGGNGHSWGSWDCVNRAQIWVRPSQLALKGKNNLHRPERKNKKEEERN